MGTCTFEYCLDEPENWSYVLFLFFTSYIIPMVLICYFYYYIIRTVRSFYKKMRNYNSRYLALAYTDLIATEARINQLAITMVAVWFLAWTPYAVVAFIGQFGPRNLITPLASSIPAISAKTCSVLNATIFGFCH